MQILPRNTFPDDFDLLKSILSNDHYADINRWEEVASFSDLEDLPKKDCSFFRKTGVYAIVDSDGHVAYIGKAKCLYDRLSSHSKALEGGDEDRAPAWNQFFRYFKEKSLVAKYVIIDGFSGNSVELAKQAIERALQIKYRPYFDQLYKKKK